MFEIREIEKLLHEAYIAAEGTRLRDEDRRKAIEVAALLDELARTRKGGHLVDAAAGKAYLGILAAKLMGFGPVTVLEREADRVRACEQAARRLGVEEKVRIVQTDLADFDAWPERIDVLVALHACGPASDLVIDAAVRRQARWLLLVPCCYGAAIPFAAKAGELAARTGISHHPELRNRLSASLIDAERTLRLEASGWQTTVAPLVPPTVTPHNLLWRARRSLEPRRMAEASEALARLRAGLVDG